MFSPHSLASAPLNYGLEGAAVNDSTEDLQNLPDMEDAQFRTGTEGNATDRQQEPPPGSLGSLPSPFRIAPAAGQHLQ